MCCGGPKTLGAPEETLGHRYWFPLPIWHHAFHRLCFIRCLQCDACSGACHHYSRLLSWRLRFQYYLLLAGWRYGLKVRSCLVHWITLSELMVCCVNQSSFHHDVQSCTAMCRHVSPLLSRWRLGQKWITIALFLASKAKCHQKSV